MPSVVHAERDAIVAGRDVTINNLFQGAPTVVARSAYLEQVRRIAPPDPPGLLGRDAELAELAGSASTPDGAPYTWWRAGPWAGKSALLSTFVLRPPAEVAERDGSCRSSSPPGWLRRTPGRRSPRCCWSSWPTCWASRCRGPAGGDPGGVPAGPTVPGRGQCQEDGRAAGAGGGRAG